MKVVLPYSSPDKHRAARLLSWLLLMGFTRQTYGQNVQLVLAHSRNTDTSGLAHLASLAFGSVEEFIPSDENESGWPEACNFLFIRTAEFLASGNSSFLWLEPDAVPLCPDFMEKIRRAYERLPNGSFMGQISMFPVPERPGQRVRFLHSGVAVYPCAGAVLPYVQVAGFPWDCQMAPHIAARMQHSPLFQDVKVCPKFRTFTDLASLISPAACVFHHSKDGALIELLSRRLMGCPETVRDPLDRNNTLSVAELQGRARRGTNRTSAAAAHASCVR